MRAVLARASDRKARHSFRRRDGTCAGEIQDPRQDAKDQRSALRTQRKSKYEESHVEDKPTTPVDTTEFARTLAEIALRSSHLLKEHLAQQSRESGEEPVDELGVSKAFTDLAAKLMTDPFKLAEAGMRMWQDYFMLWQNTMKRAMGDEPVPVV